VIDVQVPLARLLAAVLAAVPVAKEQVATGQTDAESRGAFVFQEMEHTRDAQGAAHDGQPVVGVANRELSPGRKVMPVPLLVERPRDAAEKKQKTPAHARHADGRVVSIQQKDGRPEDVSSSSRPAMASFDRTSHGTPV
jgi:hypothetical protein